VSSDIVKRLRNDGGHPDLTHPLCIEAADTIEHLDAIIARFLADIKQLRAALTLAVGELSTHTQYAIYSPDQLLEQFMQEARRG
jgi:hypothetical protein